MEAIGALAAGIVHEINTPTQYVEDNLRFLADGIHELLSATIENDGRHEATPAELQTLAADLRDACMDAIDGIGRIARIVGAMRNLSHPGQESFSSVAASALVDDAMTMTRGQWKHAALVIDEVDDGLELFCDSQAITQCLVNFIVNATQAVREADHVSGRIRVIAERRGDTAVLAVEDNGPGVPQELQAKIFEPFFTTKAVGMGTGQGLALVRQIVEQGHGGEVRLEDVTGGGARFALHVPLVPIEPAVSG
ncbi:MAG: HAMP domain-containing sensor histidine kinase [Pseudomonadota bacterium]